MKEIIKIEQKNGIETVNARELHEFLESKQEFSSWIKARIMKYGFEENEDYIVIKVNDKVIKNLGGRPIIEYHISIDMAKEIEAFFVKAYTTLAIANVGEATAEPCKPCYMTWR